MSTLDPPIFHPDPSGSPTCLCGHQRTQHDHIPVVIRPGSKRLVYREPCTGFGPSGRCPCTGYNPMTL